MAEGWQFWDFSFDGVRKGNTGQNTHGAKGTSK